MKLVFLDSENMLLFLNQVGSNSLDFSSVDTLEDQLRNLLMKLKQIYHLKISGYYSIYVSKDALYGMILKIHREDLDEFDYFHDEIEICLHIEKNTNILYKIEDPFDICIEFLKEMKLYFYENSFYLDITGEITQDKLGQLLEFVEPIACGTKEILKYGKTIELGK